MYNNPIVLNRKSFRIFKNKSIKYIWVSGEKLWRICVFSKNFACRVVFFILCPILNIAEDISVM